MDAGNNDFNLTVIKGCGRGKSFVCALVNVVDKTRKQSEIICKDICQVSPEMEYNDTHIESEKSKGGRSVKLAFSIQPLCYLHPVNTITLLSWRSSFTQHFFISLILNTCSLR